MFTHVQKKVAKKLPEKEPWLSGFHPARALTIRVLLRFRFWQLQDVSVHLLHLLDGGIDLSF